MCLRDLRYARHSLHCIDMITDTSIRKIMDVITLDQQIEAIKINRVLRYVVNLIVLKYNIRPATITYSCGDIENVRVREGNTGSDIELYPVRSCGPLSLRPHLGCSRICC